MNTRDRDGQPASRRVYGEKNQEEKEEKSKLKRNEQCERERVKFRRKETACRIKLIYNTFFVCAVNCAAMCFCEYSS